MVLEEYEGSCSILTHSFIQTHCPFLQLVLVLAEIELIFFLVTGVVSCFGFGMKIKLVTY